MKVTVLGSGNVAQAIAKAVSEGPDWVEPHEIWARDPSKAGTLAGRFGFSAAASPETLGESDLYIMAVSDDAVGELSSRLTIPESAVAVHTAGGVSIDAIGSSLQHKGVFYPLQTFTRGRDVDFSKVPVFIEYSTPHARDILNDFALSMSGSVREADSRLRIKLHTAAVFACNFTNALYTIGAQLAEEEGLSFDVLKPLITETAAKAAASSDPATVQTGPAVRGDTSTQNRHIELLRQEGKEDYIKIYELLTDAIWQTLKKT